MSREPEDTEGGDAILVAEYVLGLLPEPERQHLARRLAAEPALRAEVRLWQTRFSALDAEFAEVQPPAAVLGRLEARLFAGRPEPRGLGGLWNSLAFWRAAAALAGAVAVVAVGLATLRPTGPSPEEFAIQLVAALEQEGSDVRFLAVYDAATGSVRLTALSGRPLPDRDLELWAIEGDAAPVSMGVIPAEGRSSVPMDPAHVPGFGAGTVLAITLEPKGGSPTGDPTGPVVAKGAATPI